MHWTNKATELNKSQIGVLLITAKAISRATMHDPLLSKVVYFTTNQWPEPEDLAPELQPFYSRRAELSTEEGYLLWGIRVVIPEKFIMQLLNELHSDHPGMVRMKSLARQHIWWPNIDQEVETLVRRCQVCQDMQPKDHQAEPNPWRWPSKPWHRIHIDFAGPFLGEMFLLVVDAHSKWPEVHRMKKTTSEYTIEKLRQVFASHGLPTELVSDNGPQFVSSEFERFLKQNNVQHILSPPYHPSTNGEAERFVQTFKRAMKTKIKQKASWNTKICEFLLSYRTTPNTTTKKTPAEMMVGRNLRTRLDAVHPKMSERIQRQTTPGKPTRHIEVGEPVLARDYRHQKETWISGVVLTKLSPSSGRSSLEEIYRSTTETGWITVRE